MEVGYDNSLAVGETVADESKVSELLISFLVNVREEIWLGVVLDALNDLGDKRESKDQDFRAWEARVDEPFARS